MSVVVGIGGSRHADLHLGLFKQGYIFSTGILHPTIGVVDASGWGLALLESNFQRRHTQLSIDPFGGRPTDDFARLAIEDGRQENKTLEDPNVGDIGDPGLVDSRQDLVCQQILIDLVVVIRIGGGDFETAPADGK